MIGEIKKELKACIESVKCVHLNWIAVLRYLFRWVPFSILVGIIVGFFASLFDYLLVGVNRIIVSNTYILHLFPFFVAFLTGVIISRDLSVAGPGIGYILENLNERLGLRSLVYKFVVSLFALAGVFIAGREGPSFFMGSVISSYLSKWFGIDEKMRDYAVLIGAAAFTSALLKAPLGGAIFALEIRYVSDMDYRPFPQVIIASVFSYLVFSYFRGVSTFIELKNTINWHFAVLPYLMVLGAVVSVFVYIFVSSYRFATCISSYAKPFYRPLIGILMALPFIFVVFNHDVYHLLSVSVDYGALNTIVQTKLAPLNAIFLALSIVALISMTIGFGISGGLILPNLVIGALLGNALGFFYPPDLTIFTLSGMAAMLASSTKTPIAAIALILEISSTDLVIPITFSVIVSYILTYGINIYASQKACRVGGYDTLY